MMHFGNGDKANNVINYNDVTYTTNSYLICARRERTFY